MAIIAKTRPIVTIEAVIIRADGTRENLGEIASTEKKNIFQKIKGMVK